MIEVIKILFDKLGKQLPFLSFLIFIVINLLLILPNKILSIYSLDIVVLEYKKQLGIIALVSFILTVTFIFYSIVNFVQTKIWINQYKKEALKHLNSLSKEEIDTLLGAVRRNQRTIVGDATNFILQSLCKKGLLTMSDGLCDVLRYPFIIPEFVYDELKNYER